MMMSLLWGLKYKDMSLLMKFMMALKQLKSELQSIITIDLEMLNMKGIESPKEILKLNPNINIILVTSIIDKKEVINALKVGVKKVIQKPFTFEYFAQKVNELKEGALR